MKIGSFLKTVSTKQSEEIEKRVKRLNVLNKDYSIALNKDVVAKEAFKIISEVEKLLAK